MWCETITATNKNGDSTDSKRVVCALQNGGKNWLHAAEKMPHYISSVDVVFTVQLQPQNSNNVDSLTKTAHSEIKEIVWQLFGPQAYTITTEFFRGVNIRWRLLMSFEHDWAVHSLHHIEANPCAIKNAA